MEGSAATRSGGAFDLEELAMERLADLRRRLRRRARCRGLSLLETVVASAILAVGVASLTSVAATSARLHQSGQQKNAALRSLDAQLATIESTAFAGLGALDGQTFVVDPAAAPSSSGGDPRESTQGGTTVEPATGAIAVTAPTGDAGELVEVAVSLTWQGMNGPQTMVRRLRRSRLGG